MKAAATRFDFILNTIPVSHEIDPYLQLLGRSGRMVIVGALTPMPGFTGFNLIWWNRAVGGSAIGGIPETQEMLDFCAEHDIYPECEMIRMDQVNEAYERLLKNDVRYRFVIDMETWPMIEPSIPFPTIIRRSIGPAELAALTRRSASPTPTASGSTRPERLDWDRFPTQGRRLVVRRGRFPHPTGSPTAQLNLVGQLPRPPPRRARRQDRDHLRSATSRATGRALTYREAARRDLPLRQPARSARASGAATG